MEMTEKAVARRAVVRRVAVLMVLGEALRKETSPIVLIPVVPAWRAGMEEILVEFAQHYRAVAQA